jgi:hypothetical protein
MVSFIGLKVLEVKPGQDDRFCMQADILELGMMEREHKREGAKNDDRPDHLKRSIPESRTCSKVSHH